MVTKKRKKSWRGKALVVAVVVIAILLTILIMISVNGQEPAAPPVAPQPLSQTIIVIEDDPVPVAPCCSSFPSTCLAALVFTDATEYCPGERINITGRMASLPDLIPCCGVFQINILIDGKLIGQVCTKDDGSWQFSYSSSVIGQHTVRAERWCGDWCDAGEVDFSIVRCSQPSYYTEPSSPSPGCSGGGPSDDPH